MNGEQTEDILMDVEKNRLFYLSLPSKSLGGGTEIPFSYELRAMMDCVFLAKFK